MTKANQVSIPYLDPDVQHVGISRLRALNVTQLSELDKTLVIQDNDKPLAVLLKYEQFMAMQNKKYEFLIVDYPKQEKEFMEKALARQSEDGFELVTAIGSKFYFRKQQGFA
jgi:hypothetical protein